MTSDIITTDEDPTKPWLNATVGERWILTQGRLHETRVWVAQTHGAWRSETGRFWLIEDEDIAAIHAGVPAEPLECGEAYPGTLKWGEVIECARNGRHWKHRSASGDLAWYGPRLSAEEHAEADRIRELGGFDRAKAKTYADRIRQGVEDDL